MNKLEIKYVNIDDIKPYANNPRFNDEAVEFVANSIKQFGFKVPLVIDKNNEIVAGHTRYKASLELGLKEVPCIIADDLTDKQIKAFRIADNKTNDRAEWNDELLSIELQDVLDEIDMTDFGFGDFEISMLTEDMEPEGYDEELIGQYAENSDNFLKMKRLIINYEDGDEEYLKNLLHETKELKVIYSVKEIKENESNSD